MNEFQKRYGIVIGVSTYDPREQITELRYANNDAIAVYKGLLDNCGFSKEQLYLISNDLGDSTDIEHQAPTRANILKAIKYVADHAGDDDLICLFFAGHGVEISASPYLIAEDTKMNVLRETAIDVDELNSMLEGSSARCVLRVFDACRVPFAVGRGQAGTMTDLLERALLRSVKGWATFSACSSGEVSYESNDFSHGVFSHFLCEGLKGRAANDQGLVTLESLVDYVKISVGNWCDVQSMQQTPHLHSDLSGVLKLAKAPKTPNLASVPRENPLAALASGLQVHISSATTDARDLEFTNEDGIERFAVLIQNQIEHFVGDFTSPSIELSISEPQLVQEVDQKAWNLLNRQMEQLGVKSEFQQTSIARRVTFASTEVIVPSSGLVVAAVPFSFFYWLWYYHICQISKLQNTFHPQPPRHVGFFTFKPHAALAEHKVQDAVREMFARSSEATVQWAQQLGKFVDGRLQPLRDLETIIE